MKDNTIWVNLDEIELWQRNPNEGDIGAIVESIKDNGFNDTCHYWNGVVKAGNHSVVSLRQLRKNGWHPDQCELESTCLDVRGDGWYISMIDISHMSDAQSNALGLALNGTQRKGMDDPVKLAELLQEIHNDETVSLKATSFSEEDLDELLRDIGKIEVVEDPGAQIDRAAELQNKWQVQRGDVWVIPSISGNGVHKIMCGNGTCYKDVGLLMGGAKIEVVWTDPPYGVAIGNKNEYLNSIAPGNRIEKNLINDRLGEPQLMDMLCKSFDVAIEYCTAGAAWYVAAPPGPQHVLFGQVLKDRGIWRQTIQWVKNNSTFSPMGVDYRWKAEPIFYGWLPNAGHRYYGGRKQTTVWEIDRPTKSPEHPTMKPVELVARAVENSSRPNECVYDLYLGSGTTIVACEQTGRVGYGMEISPDYVSVCLERLSDMGLTPERQ